MPSELPASPCSPSSLLACWKRDAPPLANRDASLEWLPYGVKSVAGFLGASIAPPATLGRRLDKHGRTVPTVPECQPLGRQDPLVADLRLAEYSAPVVRNVEVQSPDGTSYVTGASLYVLMSLSSGERHGHALMLDIEAFAKVRLGPGTLYKAISRLDDAGLIEALPANDRRRPYRLTPAGRLVLERSVAYHGEVLAEARKRLRVAPKLGPAPGVGGT